MCAQIPTASRKLVRRHAVGGSREGEQNTSGMRGERGIMEQEELSWVGKRSSIEGACGEG